MSMSSQGSKNKGYPRTSQDARRSSQDGRGSTDGRKNSDRSQDASSDQHRRCTVVGAMMQANLPSPILEEPDPFSTIDTVVAGEKGKAPAASSAQPAPATPKPFRNRPGGINWNLNSFDMGGESSQSSPYSLSSAVDKDSRSKLADPEAKGRQPSFTSETPFIFRKGTVRRASMFIAEVAKDVGSMDRQIGNPWNLKPNQTKRISSVAFERPKQFEGRQASVVSQSARRPSMMIRDEELVKLKGEDDPTDLLLL